MLIISQKCILAPFPSNPPRSYLPPSQSQQPSQSYGPPNQGGGGSGFGSGGGGGGGGGFNTPSSQYGSPSQSGKHISTSQLLRFNCINIISIFNLIQIYHELNIKRSILTKLNMLLMYAECIFY